MSFIKTIEPQLIDSRLGISAEIFFRIGVKSEPEIKGVQCVVFPITMLVRKIEKRKAFRSNDNNDPLDTSLVEYEVNHPYLEVYHEEMAIYKRSTFKSESGLNDPEPSEYADKFKSQMDYLANKWENNSWTGEELQVTRYWNLKSADLVIITDEEMTELMTPYEQVD